jgi:hypothetical protein
MSIALSETNLIQIVEDDWTFSIQIGPMCKSGLTFAPTSVTFGTDPLTGQVAWLDQVSADHRY